MNKEEIGIWLKHFADKSVGYQFYEDGKWKREINLFLVFRELLELKCKVNQLETNRDEAIQLGNKQLLSNSNYTKYTDEMCLIEVLEILERGKE